MSGKLGTPAERFKTKYRVNAKTKCWEWKASTSSTGYGYFYFPPRNMVRAHVASWLLHRGDRKGLHVLHKCDNPSCVNPAHLKLGTHQDNMRDRDSKGRGYDRHGSKNGRAKLTEAEVRAIRKDDRWPRFIAADYDTPVSTIKKIRYRATWSHLP